MKSLYSGRKGIRSASTTTHKSCDYIINEMKKAYGEGKPYVEPIFDWLGRKPVLDDKGKVKLYLIARVSNKEELNLEGYNQAIRIIKDLSMNLRQAIREIEVHYSADLEIWEKH